MAKEIVIVIDPGHGMFNRRDGVFDPGAVNSEEKANEASMVLDLALTLKYVANTKFKGKIRFVFTRLDNSSHCSLAYRTRVTKETGPKAFISLHMNAANGKATGIETIYASKNKDSALALAVQESALSAFGLKSRGLKHESATPHGRLYVLHQSVPNALLECGFIDNASDLEAVQDREKRIKFATTLCVKLISLYS